MTPIEARPTRVLAAVLLITLFGCSPKDKVCSHKDSKVAVLDIMEHVYFWNDEPDQASKYSLRLKDYDDGNHLLDYLRYLPDEFDRSFSYITTTSSDQQFFGDGEYPGFGFFLSDLSQDELYITEVIKDSPADLAGFERGDRIDAIDGLTIDSDTTLDEVYFALGPPVVGVSRSFTVTDLGDVSFTVEVVTEIIVIDSLPEVDFVADVGGKKVGYMLFHVFNSPAEATLREIFGNFKAAGVTHLIVDLRYNGGGRVDTALLFNDLLGGPSLLDEVQFTLDFNPSYAADFDYFFEAEANSIDLEQIVFITTEDSASASELAINSLAPYTDVRIVGDRTFGKPVGQGGFGFCRNIMLLRAVTFRTVNSDGNGDYFNGLAPDCPADDDLSYALGDPLEASLATALTLIETDACPVTVTTSSAKPFEPRESDLLARGTTPWRREARVF